jgi:hypothetical protein
MRLLLEETTAWHVLNDRDVEPLPAPPGIPEILALAGR